MSFLPLSNNSYAIQRAYVLKKTKEEQNGNNAVDNSGNTDTEGRDAGSTGNNVEKPQEQTKDSNNANSEATAETSSQDSYDAFRSIYYKDYIATNVNIPPNRINRIGQLSIDNSKKIITNEQEAKEHLTEFFDRLTAKLKSLGKYDTDTQNALQYIMDNFKWDKYFQDFPHSDATNLEFTVRYALSTLFKKNSYASKYLVKYTSDIANNNWNTAGGNGTTGSTENNVEKPQEQTNVSNNANSEGTTKTTSQDLYDAYRAIYYKDNIAANVNTPPNTYNKIGQLSIYNSKKIITNEQEGKEHLTEFFDRLTAELKSQGKYDTDTQNALQYLMDNFRWDIYFHDYPNANALQLEDTVMFSLSTLFKKNSYASKYLVKYTSDIANNNWNTAGGNGTTGSTENNVEKPQEQTKDSNNANSEATAETSSQDLYDAYRAIYHDDYVATNVNTPPNTIENISQLSVDNSKKIITNEQEAKEHLTELFKKLTDKLKSQGKYDTKTQNALQYLMDNFRWDKYFHDYPNANALRLEEKAMKALSTLFEKNGYSNYLKYTKTTSEDLYDAYGAIYRDDLIATNVNTPPNTIAKGSQLSIDNSKKIITNEQEAKEHLTELFKKLTDKLKSQDKYDTNTQRALQYLMDNFKWDKYFQDFPNSNAINLEDTVMSALSTLFEPNSYTTIYLELVHWNYNPNLFK